MKIARRLCTLALVAVFGVGVLQVPLFAQGATDQERLTLSPAVSKPALDAGEVYHDTIKVINDGTLDYSFRVYSAPFSVKDEGYNPDFVTINERTRAFEWVSFERETYKVAVDEHIEIPYTITVPESASPGGHYAVIFVETEPQPGSQIARKKRVGNLLYTTISGDINNAGHIEGISASLFHHKPPITADIRVANTGNVHFEAGMQTVYEGLLGKKYLTYNQEVIVMPGTTRRIPMAWEKPPYLGIFRVKSKATFLGSTEQLQTKYVVLLPVPVRIMALVVLLVAAALFVIRKKQYNKKSIKNNDDSESEAKSE